MEDSTSMVEDARLDKSSMLRLGITPRGNSGKVTAVRVQLDSTLSNALSHRVSFYGVFDGHGGSNAALMAGEVLHKHVMTSGLVPEEVSSLFCFAECGVIIGNQLVWWHSAVKAPILDFLLQL